MKLIRKTAALLVVLGLAAALSACSSEETGDVSGLKPYTAADFTISIPPDWKIVGKSDFYPDIPKETQVAFTTPEPLNGFFMNVNVLKENLGQAVSSTDYARANINVSSQTLTDYEKIQEAKITIGDQETLVHIFQARLNPAEKLIRFVQLFMTKGNTGYIVTGGMLPDTPKETRDQVGAMVTSFRLL